MIDLTHFVVKNQQTKFTRLIEFETWKLITNTLLKDIEFKDYFTLALPTNCTRSSDVQSMMEFHYRFRRWNVWCACAFEWHFQIADISNLIYIRSNHIDANAHKHTTSAQHYSGFYMLELVSSFWSIRCVLIIIITVSATYEDKIILLEPRMLSFEI